MLKEQTWPGNVRQLHNELQRAMIFADGAELKVSNFQHSDEDIEANSQKVVVGAPAASTIRQAVGNVEDVLIRETLDRFKGNKKRAAEELGISRRSEEHTSELQSLMRI